MKMPKDTSRSTGKPPVLYEVIVQDIGKVHEGYSAAAATSTFHQWARLSAKEDHRSFGKVIDLYVGGEVIKTYCNKYGMR